MIDLSAIDYTALDRPEILDFIFHPRPQWEETPPDEGVETLHIPVGEDVFIGGRFHKAASLYSPIILFFHGNGEIAADYEDLGAVYREMGIHFIPVDYRGYGQSGGIPTITDMIRDAHRILDHVQDRLKREGYHGPLVLMGRSLGSASALELTDHYADRIRGVIIESGFAHTAPLMDRLGISLVRLGISEEEGLGNIHKIGRYDGPGLIIHAEHDHIIPFSEGQALYDACPSSGKRLLVIPGANHNDILFRGFREYMEAVRGFVETLGE